MESVHIHEIMHLMIDTGKTFTRDSLATAMHAAFGEDAVFHSCSVEGMNIPEAIEFLQSRGKFVPQDSGFSTDSSKMCSGHAH